MLKFQPKLPAPAALWILVCAFCNFAGWTLSICHLLNPLGYALAFALGIAALILFRSVLFPGGFALPNWRKLLHRFTRIFPLLFLLLAFMAILGGFLYPPSNPDGLTQRIPRTLNWLAEGHWFWIENTPASFNNRACGFEWLMAPMLCLLRTDRWVFLINAVPYLLFPGLIFSVLTRLDVRKRVAWYWMWLAPTGYCFAQQAGSIGNDCIGAVIALAALDFALRARAAQRCTEIWLSTLAAALLSGMKTSNLPLLLPWFIALLPSVKLLKSRPVGTAAVAIIAIFASLVPVAVINQHYLQDWTGAKLEMQQRLPLGPAVLFIANALNLVAQNLVPPVFPAQIWNDHAYKLLPHGLLEKMEGGLEPGGAHIQVMEMQFEVNAGLGLGLCLLLVVSCIAAWTFGGKSRGGLFPQTFEERYKALVRWSPFISLLVFMAKLPLSASARIVAPYYLIFLPVLLAGVGHETLVRKLWWKGLATLVFLPAFMLVVINPGRPLWPAQRMLTNAGVKHPDVMPLRRARLLYEGYAVRWDALADVRSHLPENEKNIGFISLLSSTTLETSLWRPFGHRRIWWFQPGSDFDQIVKRGVRYVVVGVESMAERVGDMPFEDWLQSWAASHHGKVIVQSRARNVATKDPAPWFVVEITSPATAGR
jgi:hypothetical protein